MRLLTFALLASIPLAQAGAAPSGPDPRPAAAPLLAPAAAAELTVVDAVILGAVEGITEFLPISSTGHLIIATRFLRLDSEQPLTDRAGQPLWYKKPSAAKPKGEPLTVKLAADTYTIVIQAGAIAAVALLYWPQFIAMLLGLLGRNPAGRKLLINVMIAFIPAAGIGLLAHTWIDEHLFSVGAVIIAQVAGAGLMFYAEWWYRRRASTPASVSLADLTPARAAVIGGLQCLAMWPGTSRSMMTIVGGYFVGLDPRRSAEFSFLLGLVTLTAASVFKGYRSGAAMIQVFGWTHVTLGAVVAAVTAAVCVRFLVHWLTRHGLAVFGWYRLALAAVLCAVFYL